MKTKTILTREQIVDGLEKFIPEIGESIFLSEDCKHRDGCRKGGLVISSFGAVDTRPMYNGIPAFDYEQENDYLVREAHEEFNIPQSQFKSSYEFGIATEINEWIKSKGWIAEWWDTSFL